MTPGPLELATLLTQAAGLAPPAEVLRLTGGKNNRVFRVTLQNGRGVVLKLYHADPRDTRDRLGAEWAFVNYAWDRGVRNLPQPLAQDRARHAGLYSLIPGEKLAAGAVTARHVEAALDFLLAVNAAPRDPLSLRPASEACFSLGEHLAIIERRLQRLQSLDPAVPLRHEAEAFIRNRLLPDWLGVQARVRAIADSLGIDLAAPLDAEATCVSPSDFGFHNALQHGEGLAFLDFEYAGRDDPAKLAGDFFCQPEVPVPLTHHAAFVSRWIKGLGLGEEHAARCHILLSAYCVKWACIILNDFLPVGAARRAYANLEQTAERCAAQLRRAATALDRISSAEHSNGLP